MYHPGLFESDNTVRKFGKTKTETTQMFGFGKKTKKKDNNQKAVEFEIVTMETASENAPQTMILNPEDEKAEKEQREMLKKQKEKEKQQKEEQRQQEHEEKRRLKLEKEKARIAEKEAELERKRQEDEMKAKKELEKKELQRSKRELRLKKQEEELERKQSLIEQKKLEEEIEQKRKDQAEELRKQQRLEKEMEEHQRQEEELRQRRKEQERIARIEKEKEKLEKELAEVKKSSERNEVQRISVPSPFLTEEEVAEAITPKKRSDLPEQAYAQALSTQRSSEIRKMAEEELERRKRLFSGRINQSQTAELNQESQSLSSDLQNKESVKKPKEEPRQDLTEKETPNLKIQPRRTRINKPLLFIALLVFLITAAAGAYYYFFVIKAPGEEWTPIEIPEIPLPLQKENTEPNENKENEEVSPILKSNILKKASLRSINPETFDDDLKKLISTLKSSPAKTQTLEQGMFVKLATANGQPIETKNLLNLLGITNQQLQELVKDEIWLFLVKQPENTLNEEVSVVNVNLVISLSSKIEVADLEGSVMLFEQDLPKQCLGLFVDEAKPTLPNKISFQASKTESKVIPQTRFFNYEEGNSRKSVDWSIARYIEENYLVLSTSKLSTEKLLQALN